MKPFALALCLLAAVSLFAGDLEFSSEITFADLQPGKATAMEWPTNAWSDNGEAVAVLFRDFQNRFEHAVARIRADGTIDPKSMVRLPISEYVFDVARMGDGMMAAWLGPYYDVLVAPLGRDGVPLTKPNDIDVFDRDSYEIKVVCDDDACLVRYGHRGVIVDRAGRLVARLDRALLSMAAAKHGFFAERCNGGYGTPIYYTNCSMEMIGDDGATRWSAIGRPVHDVIFDGARFVVLETLDPKPQFEIETFDPASGRRAIAWVGPTADGAQPPPEESSYHGRLAWNGSMYLITFTIAPAHDISFWWAKPRWLGTLRLNAQFAALDPRPVKIASDVWQSSDVHQPDSPYVIAGTPEGFRIVWQTASDYRVRTHFVGNDGAVDPPDPRGGVLIRDKVAQLSRAAAAGRSSILAVWLEDDGFHTSLRAARVSRGHQRLDAQPLILSHDTAVDAVVAASDGDGFLVVWSEAAKAGDVDGCLLGARIDAAGNLREFPIRDRLRLYLYGNLHLEYIDGAYRLALIDRATGDAEALSIGSDGRIVQRDVFVTPIPYYQPFAAPLFDGRRAMVVWGTTSLWSATKLASDRSSSVREMVNTASNQGFVDMVLARDGDDVLLLYGDNGGSPHLMRLSWDGHFTPLRTNGLTELVSWESPNLARIGPVWYASTIGFQYSGSEFRDVRRLVPFDPVTLRRGKVIPLPSSLINSRLLPGWNGEALLLYDSEVDIDSGFASLAAVRLARPSAERERPARP